MAEIQAIQERSMLRALKAIGNAGTIISSNDPTSEQRLRLLMEKMEEVSKINEGLYNREAFWMGVTTGTFFILKMASAFLPTPPAPPAANGVQQNMQVQVNPDPLNPPDPHVNVHAGFQDFVAMGQRTLDRAIRRVTNPDFLTGAQKTTDIGAEVFKSGGQIVSTYSKGKQTPIEHSRNMLNSIYQATSGTQQQMQGATRDLNQASQTLVNSLTKGG